MKFNIAGGALALAFAAITSAAHADSVNYGFVETLNVTTLDRGGVTVSGSGNVTMYVFGGLGINGGISDRVDGLGTPEWVQFSFNAGAATGVSWTTGNSSDGPDAGNVLGNATVEAWDKNGTYLGSGATSATSSIKELGIYFGSDTEFSRFRLTSGSGDSFDVRSVTFTPVPEPTTGVLVVGGVALALLRRSRRQ